MPETDATPARDEGARRVGEMTVSEAGRKGGRKVKALIEEGKRVLAEEARKRAQATN